MKKPELQTRIKAYVLLTVLLSEICIPTVSYALTGGPSQPEVQSFEPVGTSQMVDAFSGDFTYNIPLLDVNGYPVNISYHAGVSMDQEASWVGLGWNINPGTINRSMRGLPDDMNGEDITKEFNVKPNITVGASVLASYEIFGKAPEADTAAKASLNFNLGIKYNSYKGMGYEFGGGISSETAKKLGVTGGVNLGYSDDGGLTIEPTISLESNKTENGSSSRDMRSLSIGAGFNSREGLKSLNMGGSHGTESKSRIKENTQTEKFDRSLPTSGSLNYQIGMSTYTPSIGTPFQNSSINFNYKVGKELWGLDLNYVLSGYASNQSIPLGLTEIDKPGYGYMYEQDANQSNDMSDRDYLLDFNRENDQQLSKITPYLPWVNHTFDLYSVSAQGVGGTYRLHRNDLPILHDDYKKTYNDGSRVGVEISFYKVIKAGLNVGFTYNSSESGFWSETNKLKDKIGLVSTSRLRNFNSEYEKVYPQYEPVYFRDVNELVPQNSQYLSLIGNDKLVSPRILGNVLQNYLVYSDDTDPIQYNDTLELNTSRERTVRNKNLSYLTHKDKNLCLDKITKSYPMNSLDFQAGKVIFDVEPLFNYRKDDHIAEISITNSDGSIHVFGLPAYNRHQKEMSFRVFQDDPADANRGLVSYDDEDDASIDNKQGIDHYFSSTTTPSYVHSYLITGVLSPDYIDLTGNGISDDDFGSAVKFNYTLADPEYHWRVPYASNKAKYNKGLDSDPLDDMGSIVYGKKELWYLHSIEGKTHIALFILEAREDGLGVVDEHGGKNTEDQQYLLRRIELYSKREVKEFGNDAIPIKSVHFEYDYSLCHKVRNQVNTDSGKLTLRKIYFTYGNSNKGKLNPYVFNYRNEENANYHLMAYDRWGNYSPNTTDPTNAEFPFTVQDKVLADQYASLWNLNKIILPSGGIIEVNYESDDYAYVQDKRAMRMFKIKGFGYKNKEGNLLTSTALYGDGMFENQNDILLFELEDNLPSNALGTKILQQEYLKNITDLQVTVNVNVKRHKSTNHWEYIKAYVKLAYNTENKIDCGVMPDNETGWVRMEKVHIKDENRGEKVNPIAKAAWQFTRLNMMYLIDPGSNRKQAPGTQLGPLNSLVSFFGEIANLALGPNRVLLERNFCREVDVTRSWVRMHDANKTKYGGGHRVQSIVLSDEWDAINNEDPNSIASTYGQQYDYTISELSESGHYTSISSGVASYEPAIGSDENPFVRPHFYDQKRIGVPDIKYTFEHPVCESFFPGASVGYSKITVRSINHENQKKQHRTGYQVSEFYTAKDFPTIVHATEIESNFYEPRLQQTILPVSASNTTATATQGYYVELNDMHGKPKSNWSYDENDVLLSGVEYKYKVDEDGKLNNEILAIAPDGTIYTETFGVNVDFSVDARYFNDKTFSADTDINLDLFNFGPLPVFFASLFNLGVKFSDTKVRTSSSIKIVRKLGLLEETIAYKEGSKIATQNMLFDGSTGATLLTSVGNEFGDTIYSFSYPAHWAYDEGMGQAFKNWGLELRDISVGLYELTCAGITDLNDFLVPGDMCLLNVPGKYTRKLVWVEKSEDNKLMLIDEDGKLITSVSSNPLLPSTSLRVLRSGRRNMASVTVGSVTCRANPLSWTGSEYELDFTEILATSAVEYKDDWGTDLSLINYNVCDSTPTAFLNNTIALLNAIIDQDLFYNKLVYKQGIVCMDDSTFTTIIQEGQQFGIISQLALSDQLDIINYSNTNFAIDKGYKEYYAENVGDSIYETYQEADNYCSSFNRFYKVGKTEEDDYYCIYFDTTAITTFCYYDLDNIVYKSVAGVKTNSGGDLNFDISNLFVEFEFNLNDSFFIFDSITSQYHSFTGADIYYKSNNVYRYNVNDASELNEIEVENIGVLEESLFNSSTQTWDSCEPSDSAELIVKIKHLNNLSYEILFKSNVVNGGGECGSTCKILIDNKDQHVKDITQVVDYKPSGDDSVELLLEILNFSNEVDTITSYLTTECGVFYDCQQHCNYAVESRRVNPYKTGIKGNWRPYRSWTYVDDRNYSEEVNPREDGTFTWDNAFWEYNSSNDQFEPSATDHWVWTSEITEYSPFGMELENKDPLGRYSAARYGYSQTLPVAVASNTKHRQLWFEGFEEYTYLKTIKDEFICPQFYYVYDSAIDLMVEHYSLLDHSISHSGNVSLKLGVNDSLIQEIALAPDYNTILPSVEGTEHYTTEDDQIIPFRPTSGKYLLSAWVREGDSLLTDTSYTNTYIIVEFEDSLGNIDRNVIRASGLIIEEWQRIEASIDVPSDAKLMRIKYKTHDTYGWFDDLRMFPFNGNMKSYVYDFRTLRLMAELDENNFATFYEYDLEGNLIRIKKETIEGIKSLQESRQHQKIN